MVTDTERCPVCGSSMSGRLGTNCPTCLMRLGAPLDDGARQATAPDCAFKRHLGDYELLEEIARGGMGAVYRARQRSLNRIVAVKLLLRSELTDATFIKRFRQEAQAAASLNHPNIVSIHQVGEEEGQPFFSMELIEGRNLADLVRNNPLSAERAARLMKSMAEAVHFAHERRLLHRDLKPSNVLVDALDVPHITDFGLATGFEGAGELTLAGQVLGTPNYMAPEQADPKRGRTTAASDIYSLGAILYQMLTGRPPFVAETLTQTLRLLAESEPVAPRLLHVRVPQDLNTICMKCLEKEPQRRYASAQELVEELGRFLQDIPIHARPAGAFERLARWCRRKPALATSLGAGAALLLVIAIGSPIAVLQINRERNQAEAARRQESTLRLRAEAAERQTQQQLYTALLEQARATVQSGEIGQRVRALEAIKRAAAISNSAALRGAAMAALALPDLRFEREWPALPDTTLVTFDPGFERVAICRRKGPVEIYSVAGQQLLRQLPASTDRPCYGGFWSPDGRFLAVSRDHDGKGMVKDVEVWEAATTNRVLFVRDSPWGAMAFHPRLPRIIIGEALAAVVTWSLDNGQKLNRFQLAGQPMELKFAPNGEGFSALYGSDDQRIVAVHDSTDGTVRASHRFIGVIGRPDWHPGGRWVAAPDRTGAVHLLDAQTGEARTLGSHKAEAVVTVFTADGRYLFSGGWDRELICWDLKTMRSAFRIGLDSYRIQFSSDGRRCAIMRWPDVRLQLYAFERSIYREFEEDLGARKNFGAFSPNGRWLAAAGSQYLAVWDLNAQAPGAVVDCGAATKVSFTANDELFAYYAEHERDKTRAPVRQTKCFRWRLKPTTDGTPVLEPLALHQPSDFVSLCLLSNAVVFTGTNGSRWVPYEQLTSGSSHCERTIDGLNGASPDQRWLGIFREYHGFLDIHRLPGLEHVARLIHHAAIGRFEYSPNGDEVAVASPAGIGFWSTSTWQPTRRLTNFADIHYSPDARTFWLTSGLRTAGLYDARTVEPILPLPVGALPLALSADGRYLAVSVELRRIQLWDLLEVRARLRELGLDWREARAETQEAKR